MIGAKVLRFKNSYDIRLTQTVLPTCITFSSIALEFRHNVIDLLTFKHIMIFHLNTFMMRKAFFSVYIVLYTYLLTLYYLFSSVTYM